MVNQPLPHNKTPLAEVQLRTDKNPKWVTARGTPPRGTSWGQSRDFQSMTAKNVVYTYAYVEMKIFPMLKIRTINKCKRETNAQKYLLLASNLLSSQQDKYL